MNDLLSTVFGREVRLSTLLGEAGFSENELAYLGANHLESVLDDSIEALQDIVGDARLCMIISRRYGLDGKPPYAPEQLSIRLNVTCERVRQLEEDCLRLLRSDTARDTLLDRLCGVASQRLYSETSETTACPPEMMLEYLADVREKAEATRRAYDAGREAILEAVRTQLDALDSLFAPELREYADEAARLEARIRHAVLASKRSAPGRRLTAVYARGAVRWDTEALLKYSRTHPDVLAFKKEQRPYVSIRSSRAAAPHPARIPGSDVPEPMRQKAYSVEQIRQTHPRAYERWSDEEDESLLQEYAEGMTIVELAEYLGRDAGAVRSRLKKLGKG